MKQSASLFDSCLKIGKKPPAFGRKLGQNGYDLNDFAIADSVAFLIFIIIFSNAEMRKTGILCDQNGGSGNVILRQFSEARHCVTLRQTASLPELRHDAAGCVGMRQFLRNCRMIGS